MIKDILQALLALDLLKRYVLTDEPEYVGFERAAIETVKVALEAAQQEAEAWEAIETYCRERCSHLILDCEQGYDWSIVIGNPDRISPHTRLEALTNAAEWCRAEMTK